MRLVIDLQGAQGSSRNRGIGRYSLDLAMSIARNRGKHDVLIALSGLFPDTIRPLREAFRDILPAEAIRVWTAPGPVAWADPANRRRREDAELIREAFLASLQPDAVIVTSLFEGLADDVVTSIGRLLRLPTAVVLYDLIPLLRESTYLNDAANTWYRGKLDHLRRSDHLLSISTASAKEAIATIGWDANRITDISTAASSQFRPLRPSGEAAAALRKRYSLLPGYLMYTGGIDYRKNVDGLIQSYSLLPRHLIKGHQLVIVCEINEDSKDRLHRFARTHDIPDGRVVLTGYVPDGDLVLLYNLCTAVVFPSLHEGFGLPALEAMQCGRAVIASNTSSLPEVIGLEDAMFDPLDAASIAAKIEQVLTDGAFRTRLEAHGLAQARKFNWEVTARRALGAAEAAFGSRGTAAASGKGKPSLAFVSPLPPARSGIADYSEILLPCLAEHYDIDAVVNQDGVSAPSSRFPLRSVDWFRRNADHFDRVLYHFGNSEFHKHMFGLLEEIPGIVVLHDFFLSGIQSFMGVENWTQSVLRSHGVQGLAALDRPGTRETGVLTFPANLPVLQNAAGIIVHSEWSRQLARTWYGPGAAGDWAVIPLLRRAPDVSEQKRKDARRQLGFAERDIIVCSFGHVAETKLSLEVVEAFAAVAPELGTGVRLVLAGQAEGPYGDKIDRLLRKAKLKEQVAITGWLDPDAYQRHLQATDLAVQLRTHSRGETSAAVLDCMGHRIPTIVNANGSMAELDLSAVHRIADRFATRDLAAAILTLVKDPQRRARLGTRAREVILDRHDPERCARLYRDAIESFSGPDALAVQRLPEKLVRTGSRADERQKLAVALATTFRPHPRKPSLFLDASVIANDDYGTRIHRVSRSILGNLVSQPNSAFSVVPTRRTPTGRYVTALRLVERLTGGSANALPEETIDAYSGDVFLGLDPDADAGSIALDHARGLHDRGVRVLFMVPHLLPLQAPQYFPRETSQLFEEWLRMATSFDGAICVSKTVAEELRAWIGRNRPGRRQPFDIGCFQPGADAMNSAPMRGIPSGAEFVPGPSGLRPTFLMVGTVDAAGGHDQALAAFDQLWTRGLDVSLVIVGKSGWGVGALADRIRRHPENENRLFWPRDVNDEYLDRLYAASTCLIAASQGGSCGLPLIEAARHKLPILARSLLSFQEIAGHHASYFHGSAAEALAEAIESWLSDWRKGRHVSSEGMPWVSWDESCRQLLKAIGS